MLTIHDLDLMARGGMISVLVASAWLTWRDQRGLVVARLQAALCLLTGGYLYVNIPSLASLESPMLAAVDMASDALIGLLWLYARVWFQDLARVGWRNWLIALGSTVVTAGLDLAGIDPASPAARLWFVVERAIWLILALWALWITWNRRDDDLIEFRRRLRMIIVAVSVFVGLVFILVDFAKDNMDAPVELESVATIALLVLAMPVFLAMMRVWPPDLYGVATAPGQAQDNAAETAPTVALLLEYMQAERPWRDENLAIAGLAAQLGEQEYRLRRAINRGLGYRNFAQFLNTYRLDEVKQALADPAQAEVPLTTIALDAGFGSLATFHRVFREAEGVTPAEFRRNAVSNPELR